MKKNLLTLAAMLCCAMTMAVMTACSNNDDNPAGTDSPTEQTEYAILLYGFGGRNLDIGIFGNIMDFYKAKPESYGKVQIACQYKYSSAEDLQKYWFDMLGEKLSDEATNAIKDMGLQTVRFVVDNTVQSPDENVLLNHQNIYGPKNNYVANADSLTNFINWATKACPAKHYILIVSDHGGGYQPHDDLPYNAPSQTRGVLYDQNHEPNQHFTVSSLKYAIGRANAHMDVVYLDACLMNTIEYQFELKKLADYYILSSFVVPGAGGSYSVLIDELAKNAGDIETALKNFNKASVDKWDQDAAEQAKQGSAEAKWDYHDMTVTRTCALDAFGVKFKEFTDKLVAAYADESNKAKIDTITKHAFKVNNERPGYDMVDYAQSIVEALPDVYGADFNLEIGTAFNNCLVSQYCSDFLMKKGLSVDCSIMLGVEGSYYFYDYDREKPEILNGYNIYYADGKLDNYKTGVAEPEVSTWPSTLEDTYGQLAFDKATGWSRWIKLNKQLPCNNSPVEMHYPIE